MLTFLIVCPAVFLAGLIDAIGGGGGLISLPIYLLAGLPPHRAIATNKLSSSMGTAAATVRFAKMGHINFNIALSCSVTAILGSFLGASLSVYTNERIIQIFILVLLPILFVYLLFTKKDFDSFVLEISKSTYIASILSAFVIKQKTVTAPRIAVRISTVVFCFFPDIFRYISDMNFFLNIMKKIKITMIATIETPRLWRKIPKILSDAFLTTTTVPFCFHV